MCSNIGLPELIVILMLLVLVFGASRLPQLGETVGRTIRGFKRGMAQDENIEVTKLPKRSEHGSERGSDSNISDAELSDHHDDPS